MLFILFFLSPVYGFSPKLNAEPLTNETENYIYYSPNDSHNNNTLSYLQKSINLDRVYVTSNGTHLEIKFLFNDFLDRLKNVLLGNSTVPPNLFINLFIDSDDDETTGFLGYNYRYLLTSNNSKSYNNDTTNFNPIRNFSQGSSSSSIQNYLNNNNILEGKELEEIITRTLNSKDIVEKLDWVIRGYELLDYDFQPLFFSSKLNKQYLSVIPDGFKVTLDLGQIGYPSNYALLVEVGRKSADYKLTTVFGKIHIPHPDLNLEVKTINIANGKNSVVLEFNNTGLYRFKCEG